MENFTPYSALLGGVLIGTAATLMLWVNGRIAGISGILGGVLFPVKTDALWRVLFIIGLLSGAVVHIIVSGSAIRFEPQATPLTSVLAGFLVGFGTRLGSGCTSGHGICGIARVSRRSFTATLVFMLTAIITVFTLRHIPGMTP